jgi:hypothetical protein
MYSGFSRYDDDFDEDDEYDDDEVDDDEVDDDEVDDDEADDDEVDEDEDEDEDEDSRGRGCAGRPDREGNSGKENMEIRNRMGRYFTASDYDRFYEE